jgi:hypothetical protein
MADELVTLQLSPIFHDLRDRLEGLRDAILRDAQPIIRREWALSVRQRFYRTGAGLQSAVDEFVTEGERKMYRLFPTAFYMIFGEYGTGRRGAATGRPTPAGYRYGPKPGMAARRFARIAVGIARPQIEKAAKERVHQFAQNATVS